MYQEKDGKLYIFIPKCPCGRDMKQYGRRGASYKSQATADDVLTPLTTSPVVTWVNITYNCPKHPSVGYQFGMEDIVKINQYPQNDVIFKSGNGDE